MKKNPQNLKRPLLRIRSTFGHPIPTPIGALSPAKPWQTPPRRTPVNANPHHPEKLHADERGSDLIEYALVAALLALCAVGSTSSFAAVVTRILTSIATAVTNAI
jgi:Flp pilus assembly pilin Flp